MRFIDYLSSILRMFWLRTRIGWAYLVASLAEFRGHIWVVEGITKDGYEALV